MASTSHLRLIIITVTIVVSLLGVILSYHQHHHIDAGGGEKSRTSSYTENTMPPPTDDIEKIQRGVARFRLHSKVPSEAFIDMQSIARDIRLNVRHKKIDPVCAEDIVAYANSTIVLLDELIDGSQHVEVCIQSTMTNFVRYNSGMIRRLDAVGVEPTSESSRDLTTTYRKSMQNIEKDLRDILNSMNGLVTRRVEPVPLKNRTLDIMIYCIFSSNTTLYFSRLRLITKHYQKQIVTCDTTGERSMFVEIWHTFRSGADAQFFEGNLAAIYRFDDIVRRQLEATENMIRQLNEYAKYIRVLLENSRSCLIVAPDSVESHVKILNYMIQQFADNTGSSIVYPDPSRT